jgi:hypothetical protein
MIFKKKIYSRVVANSNISSTFFIFFSLFIIKIATKTSTTSFHVFCRWKEDELRRKKRERGKKRPTTWVWQFSRNWLQLAFSFGSFFSCLVWCGGGGGGGGDYGVINLKVARNQTRELCIATTQSIYFFVPFFALV